MSDGEPNRALNDTGGGDYGQRAECDRPHTGVDDTSNEVGDIEIRRRPRRPGSGLHHRGVRRQCQRWRPCHSRPGRGRRRQRAEHHDGRTACRTAQRACSNRLASSAASIATRFSSMTRRRSCKIRRDPNDQNDATGRFADAACDPHIVQCHRRGTWRGSGCQRRRRGGQSGDRLRAQRRRRLRPDLHGRLRHRRPASDRRASGHIRADRDRRRLVRSADHRRRRHLPLQRHRSAHRAHSRPYRRRGFGNAGPGHRERHRRGGVRDHQRSRHRRALRRAIPFAQAPGCGRRLRRHTRRADHARGRRPVCDRHRHGRRQRQADLERGRYRRADRIPGRRPDRGHQRQRHGDHCRRDRRRERPA